MNRDGGYPVNEVFYKENCKYRERKGLPQDRRSGYEVYIGWLLEGDRYECMYIGHGRIGRSEHLRNGNSSCIEANREYFKNNLLVVDVVYNTHSKDEARKLEVELTEKFKPRWDRSKRNPFYILKKGS